MAQVTGGNIQGSEQKHYQEICSALSLENTYFVIASSEYFACRATTSEAAARHFLESGVDVKAVSDIYVNASLRLDPLRLQSEAPRGKVPKHVSQIYGGEEPHIQSPSRVVAYVLDSGVAMLDRNTVLHRTLRGRVRVLETPAGANDMIGHGTPVCSILARMSRYADIFSVKVFDKDTASVDVILDAYRACLDHKELHYGKGVAGIVNMSFGARVDGGESLGVLFNRFFSDARTFHNVLTFVSAGNDSEPTTGRIPSDCEDAHTVLASAGEGVLASFSNFAAPSRYLTAAPGRDVEAADYRSAQRMMLFTGTSAATPVVAGLAAHLAAGGLSCDEIIACIRERNSCRAAVVERDPRVPRRLYFVGPPVASEATEESQLVARNVLAAKAQGDAQSLDFAHEEPEGVGHADLRHIFRPSEFAGAAVARAGRGAILSSFCDEAALAADEAAERVGAMKKPVQQN
jgi:hypothetical protein